VPVDTNRAGSGALRDATSGAARQPAKSAPGRPEIFQVPATAAERRQSVAVPDSVVRRQPFRNWRSEVLTARMPPEGTDTSRRRARSAARIRRVAARELRSKAVDGGMVMAFSPGDRVLAETESTERAPRRGVVEEVLRDDPRPRYRIRWDDGHESVYTPEDGALKRDASTVTSA
jgi:hypothetical protein